MFTYINPEIRERLIRDGKLFRVDADGAQVEMTEAPGTGLHLNLSLIHISEPTRPL